MNTTEIPQHTSPWHQWFLGEQEKKTTFVSFVFVKIYFVFLLVSVYS